MIRFIADIYLEEFDKDDDVSTRVQMGGVTGSGSDVAATLRRWAEQVEGAPGIFAVKNSGPSKSKLEGIQERGREFGQAFFEDVAAGRKTTGDTTTLEDLNVLAALRQDEEVGLRERVDVADGGELDHVAFKEEVRDRRSGPVRRD